MRGTEVGSGLSGEAAGRAGAVSCASMVGLAVPDGAPAQPAAPNSRRSPTVLIARPLDIPVCAGELDLITDHFDQPAVPWLPLYHLSDDRGPLHPC